MMISCLTWNSCCGLWILYQLLTLGNTIQHCDILWDHNGISSIYQLVRLILQPSTVWMTGLFCQFTGGSGGYINCINYSHNPILISNYVNLCQSISSIYIYVTGVKTLVLQPYPAQAWEDWPQSRGAGRGKASRACRAGRGWSRRDVGPGMGGWGWLESMNFMGCEWMVLGVRNGFLKENPHGQKVEFCMMVSITKIYPKLWVAWHEITKTQYQKPRFIGCNLANTLWYTHCLTIRSQYSHLWTSGSNPVMWHSHSDGWFSGTLNKQTNKQASNQANMKPQINKHKGKCVSFTDVGVRMYVYIYICV